MRGLRAQRYAGDASLYGNAERRLFLTKFFLTVSVARSEQRTGLYVRAGFVF